MHSLEQLMDKELSDADRKRIIGIIEDNIVVIGYHDLRTRRSGRYRFIQVHIDLDKSLSLYQAHAIGDDIMLKIEAQFEPAEVIVHIDPINVKDKI